MDEPERHPRALADGARRLLLLYAPLFAVALGWAVARAAGFDGATILGWLPGALSLASPPGSCSRRPGSTGSPRPGAASGG